MFIDFIYHWTYLWRLWLCIRSSDIMLRFITHVFLEDYYTLMRIIYDDCLPLQIFLKIRSWMFWKNVDVASKILNYWILCMIYCLRGLGCVSLQFRQAHLIWSTFVWPLTLQESKTFSFQFEDFDRMASLTRIVSSSTEQGWECNRVKESNQGGKDTISSSRAVPLVETLGQAVIQDGESADHGISGSPISYSSINECFQVGKWVANHLKNSTTLKIIGV